MSSSSTEVSDIKTSRVSPRVGLYFVAITGGLATAISLVCIPFVSPAFRKICLPYVPATTQQIQNVLKALEGRTGSLVDIGSGDGRIVLAAAKVGFKAHGIELNPWLIWYSRIRACASNLSSNTAFIKQNLWKYNLREYNNVVIFGVEQMVRPLRLGRKVYRCSTESSFRWERSNRSSLQSHYFILKLQQLSTAFYLYIRLFPLCPVSGH